MLLLASAVLLLPAPPSLPQQPNQVARTADRPVAVRSFFKSTMPVVADLPPQTPVRIVEERAPWAKVQVPGGLVVWVHQNYAKREGDAATIAATNVRARPLPSDGPESFPVGMFQKGDRVTVLGTEGPWLHVLAPESLAGWLEQSDLVPLAAPPEGFAAEWASAAAARTGELLAASRGGAAGGPQGGARGVAPAAAVPADDPAAILQRGEEDLAAMTSSREYDAASADGLEATFGAVARTCEDALLRQRAEADLARLEAFRKASALELDLAARKKAAEEEIAAAEASLKRRAEAEKRTPAPLETYTMTGWVQHRPGVYSPVPYVLHNATGDVPVMPVGGRFDMRDFLNREVAVRGTYRPATITGLQVLEITELRVLPAR